MAREKYIESISPRGEALGQSDAFLQFQERLSRVARVERPVLLIGERGTGKELAATRIHYLSQRWSGPCVTLNCAALSSTLVESELFGYEKGAFTGAERRRSGRFEAADGGTLFLDEIGNIPLEAQEKILRVVEYGVFERVGSTVGVAVDVRIVGATNADLPAMARAGTFKRDLLDRLSFEVLFLPPLRQREEDILLLAAHFAGRMAYELGCDEVPEFSPEAARKLQEYSWPGNIRELKNVVERAVYSADGELIEEVVFDPFTAPGANMAGRGTEIVQADQAKVSPKPLEAPQSMSLKKAVKALEVAMLRDALQRSRYNQRRTAEMLELSYDQLRGLIKKYGSLLPGSERP
ncbi:MAG: phage shock protein operon transcriptional activator [Desulfopila sp.]